MKLLLDTHTFIWLINDSPRLTNAIRDLVLDGQNDIYVSAASLWEISIKHKNKPDIFPYTAKQMINYATRAGYIFLSISIDSIVTHSGFDFGTHKDPFDQMLISQSICNNMKLITHDEILNKISPSTTICF